MNIQRPKKNKTVERSDRSLEIPCWILDIPKNDDERFKGKKNENQQWIKVARLPSLDTGRSVLDIECSKQNISLFFVFLEWPRPLFSHWVVSGD